VPGELIGLLLVLANVSIILAALFVAWKRDFNKRKRRQAAKVKKLVKIEPAFEFTGVKFQTTFSAVIENSVPPSHRLVFVYGSLKDISRAVLSGVPALPGRYDGVLFTTHYPHDLSEFEADLFGSAEAMLACSIPLRLLVPVSELEGAESMGTLTQESSLFLVPSSLMSAMRGNSFFGEVPDPTPWIKGSLLIPPKVIKRAYQLEEVYEQEVQLTSIATRKKSRRLTRLSLGGGRLDSADIEMMPRASIFKFMTDEPLSLSLLPRVFTVREPSSCEELLRFLRTSREATFKCGLVPLFHFTNRRSADLILLKGFRMSTQGQGGNC
jgi:hypothetical protein